jgi:hypothetical protein
MAATLHKQYQRRRAAAADIVLDGYATLVSEVGVGAQHHTITPPPGSAS